MIRSTIPITPHFDKTTQHEDKDSGMLHSAVKSLGVISKSAKIADVPLPGAIGRVAKVGKLSNAVIDNLSSDSPVQSSVCAVVGESAKIVASAAVVSAGLAFVPEVSVPALITEIGAMGATVTVSSLGYAVDKTVGVITEPLGKAAEQLCNSAVDLSRELINKSMQRPQRVGSALEKIREEAKNRDITNNTRHNPCLITSEKTTTTPAFSGRGCHLQLPQHPKLPQTPVNSAHISAITRTNNATMLSQISPTTTGLNYPHTPVPCQRQAPTTTSFTKISEHRASLFTHQPSVSVSASTSASIRLNYQHTPVPTQSQSTIIGRNTYAQTKIPTSSASVSQPLLFSSRNMTLLNTPSGQSYKTYENLFRLK